jgi:hypothetical protein
MAAKQACLAGGVKHARSTAVLHSRNKLAPGAGQIHLLVDHQPLGGLARVSTLQARTLLGVNREDVCLDDRRAGAALVWRAARH